MKKVSETEERIVTMALEMFNRSGVEYVGMRELAAALDMRVGNVTYYFPTKDDLVNRLSVDLAEENNRTIVAVDEVTMKGFFEMLRQVFHNHLKYRCLMLSFVHLLERNPIIAKRYAKIQSKRNETWSNNVLALKKGKYITTESQEEIDFLVSTIALIARFWISEATISYKDHNEQEQIAHYLNMIARIFLPYATSKGKKELEAMISEQ
ncbi:MAG TPA: TetR/AcrR family transcriptional regulator [Chryseolinea sp.]|nr:TetR/AcrR family transcriptional regulator [Chryseolinea sp.]